MLLYTVWKHRDTETDISSRGHFGTRIFQHKNILAWGFFGTMDVSAWDVMALGHFGTRIFWHMYIWQKDALAEMSILLCIVPKCTYAEKSVCQNILVL